MRPNRYIFGTFAALSAILCARYGCAAVGFMSKYGEIQPVQNYSSNPFWTPDSPYNARFPTPIYATGADLNTAECNNMVESLVTSYCALNNECKNMKVSDVRPKIMVQLSQLPGHNYATSCGGYIDSIFNNYQKKRGNMSTSIVAHPITDNAKSTLDIQIQNPFAIKQTEYQAGVAERTNELHELQSMNATSTELNATEFPKTAADLSLSDTMALRSAGYEPYKDKSAYKSIEIESDEEFKSRLCRINPDDERCSKKENEKQENPKKEEEKKQNKNCPDPHMDANCQCTGKYKASSDPKKCDCVNGKNPANECEDATPPKPSNGKTYALLQCRVEPKNLRDNVYLNTGKTMKNPVEALGCANTPKHFGPFGTDAIKDIDNCFTACGQWTTASGAVNTVLKPVLGQDFCSGNKYRQAPKNLWLNNNPGQKNDDGVLADHVWFISEYSVTGGIIPLNLTNSQVDAAINALQSAQSATGTACTSDKRLWVVYVLEKTDDGQWLATQSIVIGGKRL